MNEEEIISSMSKVDFAYAIQALRANHAGDAAGTKAALEAMSVEGLDLFIALLEANVEYKIRNEREGP